VCCPLRNACLRLRMAGSWSRSGPRAEVGRTSCGSHACRARMVVMVARALRRRCCRLGGSRRSRGLAPVASDAGKLAAAAFPDSPVCTSSARVDDWSDQIHRTHRGTPTGRAWPHRCGVGSQSRDRLWTRIRVPYRYHAARVRATDSLSRLGTAALKIDSGLLTCLLLRGRATRPLRFLLRLRPWTAT
jgi:hypothetical protein